MGPEAQVRPQSITAWASGARGEEKLAEALSGVAGLHVLHDRRVPGTRGNIDHIVIAPAGVFVVDAKHYKGLIKIRNRGWFFKPDYRLTVGRRDKSELARAMVWQVDAVKAALVNAGFDPPPLITPVLCFIDGDWPLIGAPRKFEGVRLEGLRSLKKLLNAPAVLDAASIERIVAVLAVALPPK